MTADRSHRTRTTAHHRSASESCQRTTSSWPRRARRACSRRPRLRKQCHKTSQRQERRLLPATTPSPSQASYKTSIAVAGGGVNRSRCITVICHTESGSTCCLEFMGRCDPRDCVPCRTASAWSNCKIDTPGCSSRPLDTRTRVLRQQLSTCLGMCGVTTEQLCLASDRACAKRSSPFAN